MAEKRKLINEMEKCFKKIDEGVEIFQEIMDKMAEANSDNQREKFQDDLKKEIKKLQRLRDQIKGWQNSSEIKDKDKLLQYRKLIEGKMETFKDVERENKTKPHSKQGLCAEEKLDPREREKADALEWLNAQIKKIQDAIDRIESKIEGIHSASEGGRKRKGKNDNHEKEKLLDLQRQLERVKFHADHLEVCMRLITNDMLDVREVNNKLKESLEMYVEALDPDNDDDPAVLEPDEIYEELNLGAYMGLVGMPAAEDEKGHKDHSVSPTHEEKTRHASGEAKTNRSKSTSSASAVPAPLPSTPVTPAPLKVTPQASADTASSSPPPPQTPTVAYSSVLQGRKTPQQKAWNNKQFSASQTSYAAAAAPLPSTPVQGSSATPVPAAVSESARTSADTPPVTYAAVASKTAPEATTPPGAPAEPLGKLSSNVSEASAEAKPREDLLIGFMKGPESSPPSEPQSACIPPPLAACPLGLVEMTGEYAVQLELVEAAAQKMPLPMDTERIIRQHSLPRAPYRNGHYPHTVPERMSKMDYFTKLTPEALFFIFYYNEGTKAQLFAARALKKLSWRYHIKSMMWFQRLEEPTKITDDFEQGNYICFDYENWKTKKRENFTFEYRFLEDKEVD